MSFGREFVQSPMNSFNYASGSQFNNFETPIKQIENQENENKATKYDYLDHGSYINRILSSEFMIDFAGTINWKMPQIEDKVNIINAFLSVIENKKLYQSLLQQSRDTIEQLKIDINSNDMKIQSLTQRNKQLDQESNAMFQRKEYLETQLKTQTNALKEKLREMTKENEQLKYRDRKYQNDIRKKENLMKAQKEKIKKLLDDRDKKSHKCLGMKLLNNTLQNSVINNSNVCDQETTKEEMEKMIERQNHLTEEKNLLQSQIAHLQKRFQSVMNENGLLRDSLMNLEVKCKESLRTIDELFGDQKCDTFVVNKHKYNAHFDKETQNLIANDIEESAKHLANMLNDLKINIDEKFNEQSIQEMKREIVELRGNIRDLEETNKEYENLIRTYVNSQ